MFLWIPFRVPLLGSQDEPEVTVPAVSCDAVPTEPERNFLLADFATL